MYYIYCIENKLNGKTYIGQHKSSDISDSYMGSGKIIKKAIKKHGLENFTKSILAITGTKENINILEKYFIASFRSEGKAEYNITDGGDAPIFSGKFEVERKLKISETSKKRWENFEYKKRVGEKISKSHIGLKRKKHSEETKKKISEASKKRWQDLNYRNIVCQKLKGRKVPRNKPAWNKGKITNFHWWTNGVDNVLCENCPIGFYKGKTISEETKKKISKSKIGKSHLVSEETKKKMSDARKLNKSKGMRGKKHSEETKKKMSESAQGRVMKNESKEKIRNYMKGRKMSIINGKRTWVKQ